MTCSWRWFIHPETAISINRNGSIPLCVFKTHYRDRGAAVPNHRIFMQIQFSGHGVRSPHYRARERRIAFHFFHLVHVALAMRGQEQKPLVTVERA